MSEYSEAKLLMLPCGGFKEDKLYCVKPTDGTGDYNVVTGEATYIEDGITKTAPANTPRIENGGVRVEAFQSTNKMKWSDRYDNTAFNEWVHSNLSITENDIVSPDSNFNADKLVESSSNSTHRISQKALSMVAGNDYTFSFYARKDERNWIMYSTNVFGVAFRDVSFNLNDFTIGTADPFFTDVTITELTNNNGWAFITVTAEAEITGDRNIGNNIRILSADDTDVYLGDGVSGIHVWRTQFEIGSKATSGIRTEETEVTRLADQITTPVPEGVTEINVTVDGIPQAPITVIPAVHELTGEVLGGELVVNGGFDTDTDWSKSSSGVTISGGTANLDSTSGPKLLYQSVLVINKLYKFSIEVVSHNGIGNLRVIDWVGHVLKDISGVGVYVFNFTHDDANSNFLISSIGGAISTLSDVSIKEVISRGGLVNKVIMR